MLQAAGRRCCVETVEISEFDVGRDIVLRMSQLNVSAHAYHRILIPAWTIADLTGSEEIQSAHLAEAPQHHPKLMIRH